VGRGKRCKEEVGRWKNKKMQKKSPGAKSTKEEKTLVPLQGESNNQPGKATLELRKLENPTGIRSSFHNQQENIELGENGNGR